MVGDLPLKPRLSPLHNRLHHQPKIKRRFPRLWLILLLSLGFRIRQRVELPPLIVVAANRSQIGIKLDLRSHTGQKPRISFLWYANSCCGAGYFDLVKTRRLDVNMDNL
jgi:hypothetical protein